MAMEYVNMMTKQSVNVMTMESESWYLDSRETNHVTRAQENIQNGMECDRSINTTDG